MLQGDIEIVADVLPLAHRINYLKRKVHWVGVEKPDPVEFHIGEAEHEVVKHRFAHRVVAEHADILRNNIQFPDACVLQQGSFTHELLNRLTAVAPPDVRNRAERAGAVAPFGDL